MSTGAQAAFDAIQARDFSRAAAALREDPSLAVARDAQGRSLVLLAIYHRASEVVKAAIAGGHRPDVFEAAALGDLARLRELVAADEKLLDSANVDSGKPLHLAAHFGQVEAVSLLLSLGADVHAFAPPPFANQALHAAAAGGSAACVARLLDAGAAVDARDRNGFTAVQIAAAGGHAEVARLLVARGADLTIEGPRGRAADLAAARGHAEVAALLGRPP